MKIKSIHTHVVIDVPGEEDVHLDVLVNDPDNNGDPNVTVKHDLPGTLLDSGPAGHKTEIPVGSTVGPLVSSSMASLAGLAVATLPAAAQGYLGFLALKPPADD